MVVTNAIRGSVPLAGKAGRGSDAQENKKARPPYSESLGVPSGVIATPKPRADDKATPNEDE